MQTAYIHDGYTRTGYVAEVPRLHPAIRFTYRPMLAVHRATAFNAIRAATAEKSEEVVSKAIVGHVVEWDVVDSKGGPVDLTVANAQRLLPPVRAALLNIITGDGPSDRDPEASEEEVDAEGERLLEAALSGRSLEETDLGNSDAG